MKYSSSRSHYATQCFNDALALTVGAVGVAMGAQGTDVALASADLVLMTNDVRMLGTCVRLSRKSRRTCADRPDDFPPTRC